MPYLSLEEEQAIIEPRPMAGFVETPFVKRLCDRALDYINAGFPVHLRGATGTGKTTLALHLAHKIGRPAVLIHGDEEYSTSDLIGGEHGYRYKYLRDNFISSVLKKEETMHKSWSDNRLTIACKYGFTLIYDEFTRSRPEANNTLLSILQEGVLDLPIARNSEDASYYLKVHPQFTAIFSSNPEEYAGTQRAQDALRDRMITLDLTHFDRPTEIMITMSKSGISKREAQKIVDLVRALRESGKCEFSPTIRACIMLAKSLKSNDTKVSRKDPVFNEMAQDILASATSRLGSKNYHQKTRNLVGELIKKYC
ncbi:gas vesicle protein GvpN [Patescibacteria group bacterium]|nr:gas vesicle protein GvpN [Patescibacteria group bacterium]